MPAAADSWGVLTFFIALLGACVGSFLNVCIYRIPRDESVIHPRSHCPQCGRLIAWYDNIPLLSYLFLRARCRMCRAPISIRYPAIEALTALLFVLIWLRFEPLRPGAMLGLPPLFDWKLLPVYWLFVGGLLLGTFVDFDHMIIPDRVTLGGIAAGLLLSPLVPSLHGHTEAWPALQSAFIGAASGAGLLWTIAMLGTFAFKKEAMGLGDVKLLGAIGAFIGWRGMLFTLMASSLAGSVSGVTLIALGGKKWQSRIPYGPYLACGALLWILWGESWWITYWGDLAVVLELP